MTVKCPRCQTENPDTARFCSNCATPLPESGEVSYTKTLETPVQELTRGTLFAERYEIIEELGKGGMGEVYRAEDKKIKEEVALKLLKPEVAADRKTIERFSNELKLARKIRHKNICGMYDLSEYRGTHYITMEYVPGQDLKSLIRQTGKLTSETAISISKQVCDGLSEAHRLGVVHRDLKPSNIMIDKDGHARIMDFGIARSLRGKGLTGSGVIIGTPEYMSPEQVEGKEVDQRADIYSLGIILYEMVTGQVPFDGDTPLSIAHKHKYEAPQEPNKVNAQIPDDLNSVIMKCLAKDKEQRHQTAEELRSELESIEKGIPTTVTEIPRRKPLTSKEITVQFTLRKALFPIIGAVVLVIVALLIWHPWSKEPIQPSQAGKPTLSIVYFKNNTGEESLDIWRSALSELLISDLSQSRYIDVLSADRLYSILRKLDLIEAKSYASEDLKKVAQESGSTHVLQGILTKSGDVFRINWTLQELPDLEVIASDMVEGKGAESFFPMVDELTQRIKPALKLSQEAIDGDIDESIGKITTSSPEAFKYYVEGAVQFRPGNQLQAIPLLEQAVVLDPEFAMAFRMLGQAYRYMGNNAESRKYLQKAFKLSDQISDRERYLIRGDFYGQLEINYDKAIEAYEELLKLYPEEPIGNNNLADLYNGIEQWNKAIEKCQRILHYTGFSEHYSLLASAYSAKGMYEKSMEILDSWEKRVGRGTPFNRAVNNLCLGKYDLALVEAERISLPHPSYGYSSDIKSDIFLYRGDLIKAEEGYKNWLESKRLSDRLKGNARLAALSSLKGHFEKSLNHLKKGLTEASEQAEKKWISDFHRGIAYIYMRTGDYEQSLTECKKAQEVAAEAGIITSQIRALHLQGNILLERKTLDEVHETTDELKDTIDSWINPKLSRYSHHLLGLVELKKGSYSKAIENFLKANSLAPFQHDRDEDDHGIFLDSLASAYYESGDLDKAEEEYKKITELTTGRLYFGDIYANSFYMLGEICEQRGDTAKAIEHYEKFLSLWKDADPGIAEVEDARKRLAELQKSP